MNKSKQIFSLLRGSWSLHRVIAGSGKIDGSASFSQCRLGADTMYYREDGFLTPYKGEKLMVYREYFFCYEPKEQQIAVYFCEDQKPCQLLHTLHFLPYVKRSEAVIATSWHMSKNDTYEGSYEFKDRNSFKLTYTITGPEKDYTMITNFKRKLDKYQ